MAKPHGTLDGLIKQEPTKVEATDGGEEEDEDGPQWGTWEQLLLACAVNRYGTNNWDSVAIEIQKRSSAASLFLTPSNCRKKYQLLTRLFFTRNDQKDVSNGGHDVASGDDGGAGSIITTDESVPLLEVLRKLRVAELRLELERYDLSIMSLQSKVKKMKEERDRSTSNGDQNSSDLCVKSQKAKRDDNEPEFKREVKDEPDKSPLSVAGEPISDKDELSVNEPISTDRRSSHEDTGTRGNIGEEPKEPDRIREEGEELDRAGEEKPVREEDSCYGSSDSVEKEEAEPVQNEVKVEPGSVSGSPDSVESVAESEEEQGGRGGQGEATTKEECSDVQSSATKSRRDGDKDHVLRGSSDHGDLEKKSKSATVKIESSVESQPLMSFLEDVKCHKLGSAFLRRLDSQETQNYKNLIRQHIDLETVQARVEEGAYLDSHLKFFRDLLLLVNNAMVFFSKNTPEFLAASELRNLISNKMSQKNANSDSSSDKQSSPQKVSLPKKENSEPSESLLLKPKLGGPLIFCRKRSSIASKATATSSGSDKKNEQTTKLSEEKGGPDAKQLPHQPPTKAEEPRITKKRSRDRFAPVSANVKKNGKNGVNTNSKQTSAATSEKSQGKGGSSSQQQQEPRSDSKNKNSSVDLKKRSAANFLNRMKQGSSSNNGPLLDALKSAPLTSGNSSSRGGFDPKKNENGKGSGKKERVSARVSDVKQPKEKGSPAKKSLGRPPKRGAAPPPPPSGKRSRDARESESVASNHKRKRSRK